LTFLHPAGFYTSEIREKGVRKGFELISLEGNKELLSHIDTQSPHRVGKYGVDVGGFEDFLDAIPFFNPSTHLIIIDEIGKMECFSEKFKKLVPEILDSETSVIATIALKGSGLIAEIKGRKDVEIFEITKKNRDFLFLDILKEMGVDH
jgi:nucleoside-triphosphatase